MSEERSGGITAGLVERAQSGDEQARQELAEALSGLVRAVARRFSAGRAGEDLVQAGYVGVFEALAGFDPSRGVQFSTYAMPFILGAVRRLVRAEQAYRLRRQQEEIASAAARLLSFPGEAPSPGSVAGALGVRDLAGLLGVGIDELIDYLDVASEAASTGSAVRSGEEYGFEPSGAGPEADMLLDRMAVRQAVMALPARHRFVIVSRFFREQSQQEIADHMGISQAQVSRLEREGLHALYRMLYTA